MMTMTTYELTSRGGESVQLYTDDTYTLSLGDPESESQESTPEILADSFPLSELARLAAMIEAGSQHDYWDVMCDSGKLARAIRIAERREVACTR
jgi:hypothetical protein